jgi:hypothetical protein
VGDSKWKDGLGLVISPHLLSVRRLVTTILYPSRFLSPSRRVMPFINLYVLLLWVLNMTEREGEAWLDHMSSQDIVSVLCPAGEKFYSEGVRAGSLWHTSVRKIEIG